MKQKREKKLESPYLLQGHVPNDPKTSPTKSCLKKVSTTSQKHQVGDQHFNTWAFGDIPDPNYSRGKMITFQMEARMLKYSPYFSASTLFLPKISAGHLLTKVSV
jgi:hypothetical protein